MIRRVEEKGEEEEEDCSRGIFLKQGCSTTVALALRRRKLAV